MSNLRQKKCSTCATYRYSSWSHFAARRFFSASIFFFSFETSDPNKPFYHSLAHPFFVSVRHRLLFGGAPSPSTGVTREAFAVFMQPEWRESMDVPRSVMGDGKKNATRYCTFVLYRAYVRSLGRSVAKRSRSRRFFFCSFFDGLALHA